MAPKTLAEPTDPRITKIAIANPSTRRTGVPREKRSRASGSGTRSHQIVYGENVQQALQFAQSGNAEVAIIALSLAIVTPGAWTSSPVTCTPMDQ